MQNHGIFSGAKLGSHLNSTDAAKDLIETAFLADDGSFAPRDFESTATIYRARLRSSFVDALINGAEEEVGFSARPGRSRYSEALKWLGQLTGHEQAFWFYICDSAQGRSNLRWVRSAHNEPAGDFSNAPLAQFEIEPAAMGGGAYLGLVGVSGKWLLLHTHYPEQEFEISIYGPTKLCNDLCRLVKSTVGVEVDSE
jgi:hypothetical protein